MQKKLILTHHLSFWNLLKIIEISLICDEGCFGKIDLLKNWLTPIIKVTHSKSSLKVLRENMPLN